MANRRITFFGKGIGIDLQKGLQYVKSFLMFYYGLWTAFFIFMSIPLLGNAQTDPKYLDLTIKRFHDGLRAGEFTTEDVVRAYLSIKDIVEENKKDVTSARDKTYEGSNNLKSVNRLIDHVKEI